MIPVVYLRSSSMNTWEEYCKLRYYLSYGLGLPEETNLAAEKGTVCHKVLEILALMKLAIQEGKNYIEDDVVGRYTFDEKDLLKKSYLSDKTVAAINKHRSYTKTYFWNCLLKENVRYGQELIKDLLNKVYDYYQERSSHEWGKFDKYTIENWIYIPLEYNNGEYDIRRREIYMPEQNFDITFKEDWARYEYEINGEKLSGQLSIKGTIDLITNIDDGLEIVDWKGLPIDTPIPTKNGWSTMGDLKIGDEIFDIDGRITKVLAKSKQSKKPCFKIYFDDKTEVVCDHDHLWLLDNNEVVKITNLKINDQINIPQPLSLPDIDLPIDPYVLGIWLGDARNRGTEITNNDSFILKEIERRGYQLYPNIDNITTKTILNITHKLRKLNLLHNKHIPEIYLRASYNQRLDLLRGLMDSDGNVNPYRQQAVFTSCNKKLSDDVKELLLSLGQRPNQCKTKQRGFGLTVTKYPIHFRAININPFLSPRKADKINTNWGPGQSNKRRIVKIEKIEPQLTQCIMVDSPTSTYLCTKNMIPTHNTGRAKSWGKGTVKNYDALMNDLQLQLYYWAAWKIIQQEAILTIFFIRDGGPTSLLFDEETIKNVEKNIKRIFEEIKNCKYPPPRDPARKDIQCQWCTFYKNKFPNDSMNICRRIEKDINEFGIEEVTKQRCVNSFKYKNPGE